MDIIKTIEEEQIKDGVENFSIGDTIKVHFKIIALSYGMIRQFWFNFVNLGGHGKITLFQENYQFLHKIYKMRVYEGLVKKT